MAACARPAWPGAVARAVKPAARPRPAWPRPAPARPLLAQMRAYATHRDFGFRPGGPRDSWIRRAIEFMREMRRPLLFLAGVGLATSVALPAVLATEPFAALERRPAYVVFGLIGINAAVFLAWKNPRLWPQLNKYAVLSRDARTVNLWSMIGSAFSHQDVFHFAFNMFVLYQFAMPLANVLGTSTFLHLYLNAATASSFGSIAFAVFSRRMGLVVPPSLGASGAVYGALGTFCYLFPKAKVGLFFIPLPLTAWPVFLLFVGYNAAGMYFQWGRIDYAGHTAGSLFGIAYGWMLYRIAEEKRRRRQQSLWDWFR
ncbi:rhomboid protein 1 [Dipodascopsis tothii]|uniref:rhomboid protein 1 n=1 Tax=Dipodascopsis tothii TaxID=44089 RepID=UPI0034CF9EE9